MRNLQDATERICELKGSQVAIDALMPAVVGALDPTTRARLMASFDAHAEAARTALLHADISEQVLATFERDVSRHRRLIALAPEGGAAAEERSPVDALLLATTPVATFDGWRGLTGASGFFFQRHDALFLVTNRHVLSDADAAHFPDRIEIGVHTDVQDMTRHATVSLPLYRNGLSLWHDATDSGGVVDVAALEVPLHALPAGAVWRAFDDTHLQTAGEQVSLGDALVIAGFPLGFHDTVHHLAVSRSASIASAYGVRFQRQGCFLTDARTHRGSSGSPVVRRRTQSAPQGRGLAGWQLLGVHSTRMDMSTRDQTQDESLGLNCAWYADVLSALTQEPVQRGAPGLR